MVNRFWNNGFGNTAKMFLGSFLLAFFVIFLTAWAPRNTTDPSGAASSPTNKPTQTAASTQRKTPVPAETQVDFPSLDEKKVPTSEKTATAEVDRSTPMPTEATEAHPTVTPTNYRFPTPQTGAEGYRLKPWTEADARQVNEDVEQFSCDHYDLRPQTFYDCADFDWYRESLFQEMTVRFPGIVSNKDLNFQWLGSKSTASSYGQVHSRSVEPFRAFLENALDEGETTPESIGEWLKGYLEVQQIEKADGLIHKDTPTWVMLLNSASGMTVFTIEETSQSHYHVISVQKDWYYNFWITYKFSIVDLNGNGRPEILLDEDQHYTDLHSCGIGFSLFEWDDDHFVNLVDESTIPWIDIRDDDCSHLSFEPDNGGIQKIISSTIVSENECGKDDYVVTNVYRWNGRKFIRQDIGAPTLQISGSVNCSQINWAVDAGFDHPQAAQIIQKALKNWPSDATTHWGPAAEDYFRFQWAVWQYQEGQVSEARRELADLRDHPADPEHHKFSSLADLFLTTEATSGPVAAVLAVDRNMDVNFRKYVHPNYKFYDTGPIKEEWGVADDLWFLWEFYSIDPRPFFIQSLQSAKIKTKDDLTQWFTQNGIVYTGVEETDVDGDGLKDWVALIGTQSDGDQDVWVLLQTGSRVYPVWIEAAEQKSSAARSQIETFLPVKNGSPRVTLYRWDGELLAFHLTRAGSDDPVVIDIDRAYKFGVESSLLDWKLQEMPDGIHLFVNYDDAQNEFVWDSAQKKLLATGFSTDLQEDIISQAEADIYHDSNYARAIEIINTLLAGKIREDFIWMKGIDVVNPPRIRPYALYLLAQAYELQGDKTNAVATYWKLWKDYPESPYVLGIMRKLEVLP